MTVPKPVPHPSPSVWEDLLEIFYAPRAVFERRRDTPAFGLALLVFFALVVGLTLAFKGLMEPVFDAEMQRNLARAIAQNPQVPREQMEAAMATGKKFLVVGVGLYALVSPLLLGLALWLVGKAVESKAEIGQAMMVATYSMFPRVLEAIANAVQMLVLPDSAIRGRFSTSLGIGRFLDPDSTGALLLGLLGRIDLFTLWVTALMVLGLSVVGRIPLGRAAIAGAVMWLVGALPTVWGAMSAGG